MNASDGAGAYTSVQQASLSQRGVEQIVPLTSPCAPGYLVFLQSRYVVLLGPVSSSPASFSAYSDPIFVIPGARARGQLSSSAIIADNVLPDAGAVFVSATGQGAFRNLDGLRAALARLGPPPPVTVRLRQRGAVVLRAGGLASAGRDLWLGLSAERVASVIAAVLHRVIAVELQWTRLLGVQRLRTSMVVGKGQLHVDAPGRASRICSWLNAPGRGAPVLRGSQRPGRDGGPPRLIWDTQRTGAPQRAPGEPERHLIAAEFSFLGVRFRMRFTQQLFGSAHANRPPPAVEWVAQIVWPGHGAAGLFPGPSREGPRAGSELDAHYHPLLPRSSRGISLGAAGRQGSSDLQQRVQGSTWPRGIASTQGFRVPIAQLVMPGQRKRTARQAAEDEVAETDIAVYDHSAVAVDAVATDLQQAVRDMVMFAVQPETIGSLKWSAAGFPTLVSLEGLATDRLFTALEPEMRRRLLHNESAQTAVERGDGHFPAVRVKEAAGRLSSVPRLAAVFDECLGPAQLEASTRAGYQALWRLVVTWGIAHKCLQNLLPMSRETIKALTQELLMVGCAAGTIRNVWSSIADRHRRFGLAFPFSSQGEFSRMCKAVAAVVGTPSRIIFPIGAHHVQRMLELIGLTDEQTRSVLMTCAGTLLSSRVVEVSFFQPCDFLWELDKLFHDQYEGTTAVHVYRRKQDTGRRGLWPRIGRSRRAEWDIVSRLQKHAEKYCLEVSPLCTKGKFPGAQCRHCGNFFFREQKIRKGEDSAKRVQMSRQQVTNGVKASLQLIGVDTTHFSGLSMRRGGDLGVDHGQGPGAHPLLAVGTREQERRVQLRGAQGPQRVV